MQLAGVIYLSSQQPAPVPDQDRRIFQEIICGDNALSAVIVGTVRRGTPVHAAVEECGSNLKDVFWKGTTDNLSAIHEFKGTYECAWKIINHLAHESTNSIILRIQQEWIDVVPGKTMHPSAGSYFKPEHKFMGDFLRIFLMLFGVDVSNLHVH